MRRCFYFPAVAAAVLTFSAQTSVLRASTIGVAIYTLTAADGLPAADPNSPMPQVLAEVGSTGAVLPLPHTAFDPTGPLTTLQDSHGFDPQLLKVGLANMGNDQLLGLSFGQSGFQPGGDLHFALAVDGSMPAPPELVSLTPGVSITLDTALTPPFPEVGAPPFPGPASTVPEPLSVLTWSALIGLGLVRVRAVRRARVTLA